MRDPKGVISPTYQQWHFGAGVVEWDFFAPPPADLNRPTEMEISFPAQLARNPNRLEVFDRTAEGWVELTAIGQRSESGSDSWSSVTILFGDGRAAERFLDPGTRRIAFRETIAEPVHIPFPRSRREYDYYTVRKEGLIEIQLRGKSTAEDSL